MRLLNAMQYSMQIAKLVGIPDLLFDRIASLDRPRRKERHH
jgi:hypothetical protein